MFSVGLLFQLLWMVFFICTTVWLVLAYNFVPFLRLFRFLIFILLCYFCDHFESTLCCLCICIVLRLFHHLLISCCCTVLIYRYVAITHALRCLRGTISKRNMKYHMYLHTSYILKRCDLHLFALLSYFGQVSRFHLQIEVDVTSTNSLAKPTLFTPTLNVGFILDVTLIECPPCCTAPWKKFTVTNLITVAWSSVSNEQIVHM